MTIAVTAAELLVPVRPLPKADQLKPSHFATRLAGTLPACVKEPPTYTSLPFTTMALTVLLTPFSIPVPRLCQKLPSQRTTRLAANTPRAAVNRPPR